VTNVFAYRDYRSFLKDYYDSEKKRIAGFSFERFSRKIGASSKGFIHNVMRAKRNISSAMAFKLAKAIKLNKKDSEYFQTLVAFNQAKNLDEKNFHFDKLSSIDRRVQQTNSVKVLQTNQFEFYSKYYHSVIRSLIDLFGFNDDYNWLAKNVRPRITPQQAKNSVKLLETLSLIKKDEKGKFKLTNKTISTPKEIQNLAIFKPFLIFTKKLPTLPLQRCPTFPRNNEILTV